MNTQENNKLIAEFMEVERTYNPSTEKVLSYALKDDVQCLPHELQYHKDWNWLMPVVDKCYQEHMSKHIADAVMTCNRSEVYQAVVEFIKEYNK